MNAGALARISVDVGDPVEVGPVVGPLANDEAFGLINGHMSTLTQPDRPRAHEEKTTPAVLFGGIPCQNFMG